MAGKLYEGDLYEGDKLLTQKQSEEFGIDPYIPSGNLIEAVKLAQLLQRPLLVKGEPGCGKSRLAEAVAAELHGKVFGKTFKDEVLFEWNVKSNSKAQDGLYVIDNLQRLSDANIQRSKEAELDIILEQEKGVYKKEGTYVALGELGKAFQLSNQDGLKNPPVVLIDEIDKADIDFPNDLLLELDRMEFKIPGAKDKAGKDGKAVVIKANPNLRPLVIITSNDEKPLPPAFLRRCLFHFIDFKEIKLQEIVESMFPALKEQNQAEIAVAGFKGWRKKIEDKGTSNRHISTGEMLDWIKLINRDVKAKKFVDKFDPDKMPPNYQALLKDVESIQVFAEPETKKDK
jgi:MoxR-like ATPase